MKVIGLTGGTGSGKGAVSDFLKEKGVYIVDTDKIAHDIILKGNEAYDELVEYAMRIGVRNAFIQEGGTQSESFIPDFDGTGVAP